MSMIFHFITRSEVQEYFDLKELKIPSLEKEGFIHCSLAEQVIGVANAIRPGRDDLILLEIDESKVTPKIVYENLEGGEKLFPHIYGPLNGDAIVAIYHFLWDSKNGYQNWEKK